MTDENKNYYIYNWLLLITFLVALMIVVGGLTRLTDSGLSITKWDLFSGILPPFTTNKWEDYFSLYKEIPEFKLLNNKMTLNEFKIIFWWEYLHRLLGRIIGLFYLIPLLYFSFKGFIKKEYTLSLYIILFLIIFQGVIGWYMVKSGLTERVDVSHFRLALHLSTAFVIFVLLFWNYLKLRNYKTLINNGKKLLYLPSIFVFLIFVQITFGAFVSGLDAGTIYQTWPLMNQSYFPDDSSLNNFFSKDSLENPSVVQFLHRNIAYLIFIFFIAILIKIFRNNEYLYLRKISLITFVFLCLQMFLGILTILQGASIFIASMHQVGSIFLITSSLIFLFQNYKNIN